MCTHPSARAQQHPTANNTDHMVVVVVVVVNVVNVEVEAVAVAMVAVE